MFQIIVAFYVSHLMKHKVKFRIEFRVEFYILQLNVNNDLINL